MSAIFISHSDHDNAAAEELRRRLEEQGHRSIFLDFDPARGIPAGRSWEREVYSQLRACRAVAVLCSPHSMSSQWCFAEITHAKALGKELFPLKIADCEITPLLSDVQIIDLTSGLEEGFQRLWRGLELVGLDPKDQFDWDGTRPPYPGLPAFQEEDAAVFFGRDGEVGEGLDVLRRYRNFGGPAVTLVLGPSGSGKSSLLRAGLIPRLRRDRDSWIVVDPFRPLEDPFKELAIALAKALESFGSESDWTSLRSEMLESAENGDSRILIERAEELRITSGRRQATVLLAIDQLEELLGHESDHPAHTFLPFIRGAVEADGSALAAIATLRSEFLGDIQRYRGFEGARFNEMFVAPMSVDGFAEVIEKPAELAGAELGTGLVQLMVDDTKTEDALPLLAFTLRELWEQYGADNILTVEEYRDKLGGLQGSVAKAAEAAFSADLRSQESHNAVRDALLSLVRVNEEGKYVKRPRSWSDLPEAAHPVLEELVSARLLASRSEGTGRVLEIAHEALLRAWGRMVSWLEEDREFLLWQRRLEGKLRERRTTGERLTKASLSEALAWVERRSLRLTEEERDFIVQSHTEDIKRKRWFWSAAVIISFTLVTSSLVALIQGLRASERAEQVRVAAVLATLGSIDDPLLAALVASGLKDSPEPPSGLSPLRGVVERAVPLHVLRGHAAWVHSAAFSPDGEWIVTASDDRTARVWRADSSGEPAVLAGHARVIRSAVFSPDGARIVTASDDGTARVWPADGSGEPVVLAGHAGSLRSAMFSPDGARIVTASYDNTARVWSADGSGEPVVLAGHADHVMSVAFSPDGERIVTASDDGTARVWSADGSGEPVVLAGHADHVLSAVFSPDGERIVTASDDGTARVWSADGLGEPMVLAGHAGSVRSAVFSPDGERIVTASDDGTARVWRVSWNALLDYVSTLTRMCLEPSDRQQYLGESAGRAHQEYVDCQRRNGRTPR